MNFAASLLTLLVVGAALLRIWFWRRDEETKLRTRGWNIQYDVFEYISQVWFKKPNSNLIAYDLFFDEDKWLIKRCLYKIHQLAPDHYQAGCFTGSYDQLVERLNARTRTDHAKAFYQKQIDRLTKA